MEIEEFEKTILSLAEKQGQDLSRDGDWAPMFFTITTEGKFDPIHIPPWAINDQDTKEALAKTMTHWIIKEGARAAAFMFSSWCVKLDKGADIYQYKPSEHPNRQEELVVYVASRGYSSSYISAISRHGSRAPTLGQWQKLDGEFIGLFADAMKKGFEGAQKNT